MSFNYVERDRPKKASCIKIRLIIVILTSFCPIVCYIGRQNLPFAIVSMVDENFAKAESDVGHNHDDVLANKNSLPDSILGDDLGLLTNDFSKMHVFDISQKKPNATTTTTTRTRRSAADDYPEREAPPPTGTCPDLTTTDESGKVTTVPASKTYGPKYNWNQDEKGLLLGAFFYTYVAVQIPGARLAEKIGAKSSLSASLLGTALLNFISPWSASVHVYLFSVVRFAMGIFQAALFPACYVLYSKWLPPSERSQALPFLGVGAFVGSIVASALAGYFSESEQFGWEYSFYVPGVFCFIWSILWIWFASNEPRDHKYISIEELQTIELRMGIKRTWGSSSNNNNNKPGHNIMSSHSIEDLEMADSVRNEAAIEMSETSTSPAKQISWRKLLTSRSIWAMMAAFFASNWSFNIVMLLIPTYLNRILRVSPVENGMINSVIYIICCIASPLVGTASTMMVETRACGLSRLAIRKLFQGSALFGQAACFVSIAWFGCDRTMVFAVLYIQIAFYSLVNGGEVQLPSELSLDFSGTIYAIGNCVGSSAGFIAPYVYGKIVTEEFNQAHWEVFFYVAAMILALGGLIFLMFGQNKTQDFSQELDDSRVGFANFGGLSARVSKSGSFNLENSRKQHYQAGDSSSIRNLSQVSVRND